YTSIRFLLSSRVQKLALKNQGHQIATHILSFSCALQAVTISGLTSAFSGAVNVIPMSMSNSLDGLRCNALFGATSERAYTYTPSYDSLAGGFGTSSSPALFTLTRRTNSLSGSSSSVPAIRSPLTLNCHSP